MHDPNMFSAAFPGQSVQQAGQALASGSPQPAQQFASDVRAWANSAAQMKSVAASGGFAVDPKGGQAYVDLYNRCIEKIRSLEIDIRKIVQTYQLGTSPGAVKIAPWNLQVAVSIQGGS